MLTSKPIDVQYIYNNKTGFSLTLVFHVTAEGRAFFTTWHALKKEKVPLPSSIPAKSGGGTQKKMELRKAKIEGEQQFLFDQATTDKLRSEGLMFRLI
ncbi:hypothetical protein YC2023_084826 [Brassica napus]|uniref:Uncharacterized protein n=2 Tax=Brassica TaxID=3705 RepID=A0A0D3D9J7_BRAOL|nr:unnamed protein product [Brassica napus]